MNGGELVAETLIAHGIDTFFTVPGESFLTVLEALRRHQNSVRLVTTRHESGASFAADAYAKISGRPAVVMVSRGPGATNAAIGVHTAKQDSTPMLLFMGQVTSASLGREAFQEIDPASTFASLAKGVFEPTRPEDIGQAVADALALARDGRPGPVVVAVPKDLGEAEVGRTPVPRPSPPAGPVAPEASAVTAAARLLAAAERPLIVAGEAILFAEARDALVRLAEASGAPVIAAYRRQDAFPNDHEAYIGHLEINRVAYQRRALERADVVLAAGSRLDGITGEDFAWPAPTQSLIHLYPDGEVLKRFDSAVAVAGDPSAGLDAIARAQPAPSPDRLEWRDGLRRGYLGDNDPGNAANHGAVNLALVVREVAARLDEDAVVLTDGGSFARWVHRYHRFTRPRTQAGPIAGAMGYAVPGAVGAALARPGARIVAYVGDGGFMMTGQELATALEQGLDLKVIVCDNSAHGSILQGQLKRFGAEGIYGTRLASPDFAGLARAYGAPAWRVETTEEFAAAFEAALAHIGPALLHLITDERDIHPFGEEREAV